jgi:hypothetical protein
MSLPPEAPDEIDDRYRRASERDASRPGEAVRHRVLQYAAQLAAQRAGSPSSAGPRAVRRRQSRGWRPAATFGTLAAAIVAGLVIAPRFLIAPVSQTAHAPQPSAQAELRERKLRVESAPAATLSYQAHELPQAAPPVVSSVQPEAAPPVVSSIQPAAKSVAPARQAAAAVANSPRAAADVAEVPPVAGLTGSALAGAQTGVQTQEVVVTGARRAAAAPPAAKVTDPAAAFRRAAESGDLGALDRLLEMQPDINARDTAGRTPLMLAILHGHTDVVSALLAYGADPNAADGHGTTPLQAARAAGRPAIIEALQRYGAR